MLTTDVEALQDNFNWQIMKVLQFAFNGMNDNPCLPENVIGQHLVVYKGTLLNPTTLGWWRSLDQNSRNRIAARIN